MDSKVKQTIINQISSNLITGQTFTISYKDRALATILPVEDYQKFQRQRTERLKDLKRELNGLVELIRSHTGHQTLAEVEAQLAVLRHNIEQEMGK
jgi:hypothetical protein